MIRVRVEFMSLRVRGAPASMEGKRLRLRGRASVNGTVRPVNDVPYAQWPSESDTIGLSTEEARWAETFQVDRLTSLQVQFQLYVNNELRGDVSQNVDRARLIAGETVRGSSAVGSSGATLDWRVQPLPVESAAEGASPEQSALPPTEVEVPAVRRGTATSNLRPLKVWLVRYSQPFASLSPEQTAAMETGIITRLQDWYTSVLQHANNRTRPAGYENRVEVQPWIDAPAAPATLDATKISDRDIVIYFTPDPGDDARRRQRGGRGRGRSAGQQDRTRLAGPVFAERYRPAADHMSPDGNSGDFRTGVLQLDPSGHAGGVTIRPTAGPARLPALSQVFASAEDELIRVSSRQTTDSDYQEQFDRVLTKLAICAFHEAGHNKTGMGNQELHAIGNVFASPYSPVQQLSENVRAVSATHIWNWCPQYLLEDPLVVSMDPAGAVGGMSPEQRARLEHERDERRRRRQEELDRAARGREQQQQGAGR